MPRRIRTRASAGSSDPRTLAMWGIAGANVLATVAIVVLLWILGAAADRPAVLRGQLPVIPLVLVSTAVAVLILRRDRRHAIGWILLTLGAIGALLSAMMHYGYLAIVVRDGTLPGGYVAAWGTWILALVGLACFPILPLSFPDGRLPSPRWRPLLWSIGLALLLAVPVAVVFEGRSITSPWAVDPFQVDVDRSVAAVLLVVLAVVVAANLLAGGMSVVARYRASGSTQRRQIKWFAYGTSILAIAHGAILLSEAEFLSPWTADVLSQVSIVAPASTLFLVLTIGIAILRHRLYDIDVVINKTLVYAALAALIGAVYVAVVVGIGRLIGTRGEPDTLLTLAATVVVAITFQPARERLQRIANRIVFGERADPYQVLADFSRRLGGAIDASAILPRIAETAARATAASWAQTSMFLVGGGTRRATWPLGTTSRPGHTVPVHHRGERVGSIAVAKPAGDPIQSHEQELLEGLAQQSGVALHNVRLTAQLEDRLDEITRRAQDLVASRRRLMHAADRERRRVESEIARRLGPAMRSVRKRLDEARETLTDAPDQAGALLEGARLHTKTALEELRSIARGVYPPLLGDRGLGAAIHADVRKLNIPAIVRSDIPENTRLPSRLETTAYFCTREALDNIARHADADHADIHLVSRPDHLHITITDDGTGFDPAASHDGIGLQLIADRAAALGGDLQIDTTPGRGTTITIRIPTRGAPRPPTRCPHRPDHTRSPLQP